MSLNEERMMILKMLQDGKISSDEAAKLLEALDGGKRQTAGEYSTYKQQKSQANYYDEVARFRERINDWRKEFTKNHNQKDFDRMVDDFSAKAEKIGKNVATATSGIVDKVIDFVGSVVDTGSFNIFGSYNVVEKSFEAAAREDMDLELEGVNGQIVIKKHQEDKIVIKSKIRSPQNNSDQVLAFSDTGSAVSLKLAMTDSFSLSVSHEVYIPAVRFNKIRLETKNGKIFVEDALSQEFESITKNATIDLMGVNSGKISVDTKNAKVCLNYVIGRDISINTKNSIIDIKNLKAEKLGAYTANGRIVVENVQNYDGASELQMDLRTKNGEIKTNMNDMDNRSYRIKARTSNGGVNLLVPGLLYQNTPRQDGFGKLVEAESSNYNNAPQRVNINAETYNGYIEVVK